MKIKITSTYQIVTPESAEDGEAAASGWEDQEGTTFATEDHEEEDDPAEATIDAAVDHLLSNGATEPSSIPVSSRSWWSTPDPDIDYQTGEHTYRSFHLEGDEAMVRALQVAMCKRLKLQIKL